MAVPPLHAPAGADAKDFASLSNVESVRLFVERARSVRSDFRLTEANAPSVLEICMRLDGIPLAIELAAARLRHFSVEDVARRLGDRFRFLTQGDRTSHERHQTLAALIDWSYGHLDPHEQTALRRLALFAGGWTLEAAEAVASGDGIDAADILDLLTQLVDRSLVETAVDFARGSTRYRMLETIQAYAREQMTPGEAQAVRARHQAHFLRLAEETAGLLRGPDEAAGLSRLEADLDNLGLALTSDRSGPGGEESAESFGARVRLAGSLGRFWSIRGYLSMGVGICATLLAAPRRGVPAEFWARLLNAAGILANDQGRFADMQALCSESLAMYRTLGDERNEAGCLNNLALVALWQGDTGRARKIWEEALSINRRIGNRNWEATNLLNLGLAAYHEKRFAEAGSHLEGCLALARELGDVQLTGAALDNLGNLADEDGRLEAARRFYDEALALRRQLGDRFQIAVSLGNLGCLMQKMGDIERAWALVRESLEIKRELGNVHSATFGLEAIASLAIEGGAYESAVRLLGAADAIRESIRTPRAAVESEVIARELARAKTVLGEGAFHSAYSGGRRLSVEEAIAEALGNRA